MRKIRIITMFLTGISLLSLPSLLSAQEDVPEEIKKEIAELRLRAADRFLKKEAVDPEEVATLLKTLGPDGLWEGVDYSSKRRSNWPIYSDHFLPTNSLARALFAPQSPYRNDPELKKALLSAVDAWLTNDWRNPNWWYEQIGSPLSLGPVLLLLQNDLTPEQLKRGIEILKRGKLAMGGANLVWLAEVTLYRGLVERSPAIIRSALKRMANQVRLGNQNEGIQYDWSFYAHGQCLYSTGYGFPFIRGMASVAAMTQGTSFAMEPKVIERVVNTTLDGCQWMVFGPAQDYGANGRAISRPGLSSKGLLPVLESILQLSTGREEEIRNLQAHLQDYPSTPPLVGNRHFWNSDIMTHKRKGYYASARMYSTRLFNTDSPVNNEGLKNHYIADGCNFLFRSGHEYTDIFPVWDWQKVPGTTVVQDQDFKGSPRRKGESDFVGGVSDDMYGMSAFDFIRGEKLSARKAWFFFDEEYVCLGAGITSEEESPVATTIQQSFLNGDVSIVDGSEKRSLSKGEHRISAPVSVYHDGVGYVILNKASVFLSNTLQRGKWSRINRNSYAAKDEAAHEVFSMGIDHGTGPKEADYAYIVCPGMDEASLKAYSAEPPVQILHNTKEVQAVWHPGLQITQIAFYSANKLNWPPVAVDKPCLLMIRNTDKTLAVTLSDPTQQHTTIQLTLEGQWNGEGCVDNKSTGETEVTFELPTGGYAGKSIQRELVKR